MSHPIVHVELHTTQPAAARDFYARLFGWEMKYHDAHDYTSIEPGEGPRGGVMGLTPHDGGRPQWIHYVDVEDVDAAASKAVELGAVVRLGRTEVPGMGWFAWLDDPAGARFGLWQGAKA